MQHGVSMYFGSADRLNREHLKKAQSGWSNAPTRRGYPITFAGAAWMDVTRTICCRCPTHLPPAKATARKIREAQRFSRSADLRREREQLRGVSRLGNDGVGISERSGRAGRLRNSARREQHLCLVAESRFRSLRIPEQRSRPSRRRRFTSRGIRSSRNTFSIRTIIRCSIRSGRLYAHAIKRAGRTATLLEWDDRIPSFDEVHHEALKANRFLPDAQTAPRKPKLADLQRSMSAQNAPAKPPEGHAPGDAPVAAELIKPNDRLNSFERLQIYNQQYWWRLLGNFGEDFHGLRAVLGERKFDRIATEYLQAHPSTLVVTARSGSKLESFLATHPALTEPQTKLALEMVRVEWARIIAFDGPGLPPLDPRRMAHAAPERLTLSLQPYLSLLELWHPIDEMLGKLKVAPLESGRLSNAVAATSPPDASDSPRRHGKRPSI